MNVVVDTNVILSGLAMRTGCPADIYEAWVEGRFNIVTCEQQIHEVRGSSNKPYFSSRVRPHKFGRLVNKLRHSSRIDDIPRRHTALDPTDSYLLDLAVAAHADYLVTGDKKAGLLQLGKIGSTRILLPSEFCISILKLQL